MKTGFVSLVLGIFLAGFPGRIHAQDDEIQQLLLNVQKLEHLKEILESMKEKYQVLSQGYQQVNALSEGNFRMHEVFLNRLLQVNPKVKSYYRVSEIIRLQIQLVQAISASKNEIQLNGFLDGEELGQVLRVYSSFSASAFKNLEELTLLLSDGKLQMDDWERIQGIDRVYESMQTLANGLGKYHVSLQGLTSLRKSKLQDSKTLKNVLGHD